MLFETDGRAELPDVVTELVVVVPIGHVRHEVGQAVGDGIELVLGRVVTARLAVLEQRDEEERDDRRGGVDLELIGGCGERRPSVARDAYQPLYGPENDEQHAKREERGAARDVGDATGEPVEEPDPARYVERHEDRLMLVFHDVGVPRRT